LYYCKDCRNRSFSSTTLKLPVLKNKIGQPFEEVFYFNVNIEFCQLEDGPNPINVSTVYGK
jgi:hypothetical protein